MIVTFSVGLAYVLTSIDGLILFATLVPAAGLRRAVVSYLIAHTFIVGAAFAVGRAAAFIPADKIGYLGLIPIALGLQAIWRDWKSRKDGVPDVSAPLTFMGATIAFATLSFDSMAILVAFLAESPLYIDYRIITGAVGAILLAPPLGWLVAKSVQGSERLARSLERLGPFIMIAAGIYVLLDTSTDLL